MAQFIGRMNFFRAGGKTIAIRPERASLSSEKPVNGFAMSGTVRHVLYLGATLEVHLELDSGERGLVEAPNHGGPPKFQAGERAWFSASPESCLEM